MKAISFGTVHHALRCFSRNPFAMKTRLWHGGGSDDAESAGVDRVWLGDRSEGAAFGGPAQKIGGVAVVEAEIRIIESGY